MSANLVVPMVASGISSLASTLSQDKANAAQRDMFHRSLDFSKYQYEDSKRYNSASAQVSRLRQAGLNPFLSDVSSGASSPIGSPSAAGQSAVDYSGSLSAGSSLVDSLANSSLVSSQQKLNESQSEKNVAEAQGQTIENAHKDELLLSKIYQMNADSWQKDELSKLLHLDFMYQKETMSARIAQQRYESAYKQALAESEIISSQWANQKYDAEVQHLLASAKASMMSGHASLKEAHAAIMNAYSRKKEVGAMYGNSKEDTKKFFEASLDYLMERNETERTKQYNNINGINGVMGSGLKFSYDGYYLNNWKKRHNKK